jgi:hypothetical protein
MKDFTTAHIAQYSISSKDTLYFLVIYSTEVGKNFGGILKVWE